MTNTLGTSASFVSVNESACILLLKLLEPWETEVKKAVFQISV